MLRTLGTWTATTTVTIDLESHGRESIAEGMDLSRTVGWFTSIYPVSLSAPDLDDLATLIPEVKEQLRATPNRGVGYGALRHLTPPTTPDLRRLRSLPTPSVSFNYLGSQAATTPSPETLITQELPSHLAGHNVSEERTRPHTLAVEATQTPDGRLLFEWYYTPTLHRADTIETLATRYVDSLEQVIAHCLNPEAGTFTPSDFPLAGLDADSLAAILRQSQT